MESPRAQVPLTFSDSEHHTVTRGDLDRVEAELAGVERALTRLDDATFGTCEHCQVRLDEELLAAEPLAPRCLDHR
jgi:RNA polymerase-binding transcription factor DksA